MKNNKKQKNIPNMWKVCNLGDLGKVSMCKRILKDQTSEVGDIPFFKIGTFGKDPDVYISSELYETYKAKYSFPKKGDILISASGTIGRTVVYDGAPAYFQDSNIIWIANNENVVSNPYLNYLYKKVRWNTASGTIARLYNDNVRSVSIVAPPLSEQNRIVTVLETWDSGIEKLKQKIAIKKEIKKGLMQELLTGKKRLPGFSDEWVLRKLDTLFDIKRGGSPRPINEFITNKSDGLNWLKIGDIKKGAKYIDGTSSKILKEGLSRTTLVKSGDFILSNSMSFGRPYISKIETCVHDGWLTFQNIKKDILDSSFLYYLLLSPKTQNEFKSISAGSGVQNLKKETVAEVALKFPGIEEQKEIAEILTIADNEITTLEKKLTLWQEQKKYLLNNLVTGQIRTPENLLTTSKSKSLC